jgi:hypothetical protein
MAWLNDEKVHGYHWNQRKYVTQLLEDLRLEFGGTNTQPLGRF